MASSARPRPRPPDSSGVGNPVDMSIATELAKLSVKLDGLVDQLKESNARNDKILQDHEGRIRWLEHLAWGVPVSLASCVATAFVALRG